MLGGLIAAVLGLVGKGLDKAIPDAGERERIKAALTSQVLESGERELEGAIKIIIAEATGESWLQRNWRPLTMVTFVGLVVARWLGFSAPGITEALELQLFEIIKLGLSGYVVGRSLEKIAPSVAEVLRGR